jgi:hypothetical protein
MKPAVSQKKKKKITVQTVELEKRNGWRNELVPWGLGVGEAAVARSGRLSDKRRAAAGRERARFGAGVG